MIGNRLYVNDTRGTTYLLDPDPTGMKVIATNSLDENQHTNASPAFANGTIFFRTDTFLYGIR